MCRWSGQVGEEETLTLLDDAASEHPRIVLRGAPTLRRGCRNGRGWRVPIQRAPRATSSVTLTFCRCRRLEDRQVDQGPRTSREVHAPIEIIAQRDFLALLCS